jgi:hypothetical protein
MRLMTTPSRFVLSRLSRGLYLDFLAKARARGRTFVQHRDFLPGAALLPSRYILLRHDIDFAPAYSLEMAELEHAEGIRSTYFVLMECQYYNPVASDTIRRIRKIHALGHEVGLHVAVESAVEADPGREVALRLDLLSNIVGAPVRSFSQHDPVNAGWARFDLPAGREACVDAYEIVKQHNLLYVSESAMMWRQHTFDTALDQDRNLCLLAHPHSWLHPQHDYVALVRELESEELRETSERFDRFVDRLVAYYDRRVIEGV